MDERATEATAVAGSGDRAPSRLRPPEPALRVVRPHPVSRVVLPAWWLGLGAIVVAAVASSGLAGLWLLAVGCIPGFAYLAATCWAIRVEVDGQQVRVVGLRSTHEFAREDVARVTPAVLLFSRPPGTIWFVPHAEVRKRTRRHPEGRLVPIDWLALPAVCSWSVADAIGFPPAEPLRADQVGDVVRRAFVDERGRPRGLAYAYLGGIALMALAVALRA